MNSNEKETKVEEIKNEEIKKKEVVPNVLNKVSIFGKKTLDLGKKAADGIQKGAIAISEKAKQDALRRKIEKLHPLFPKDFKSKDFKIPNIIKIVDDAIRRDIEVCKGAIGWLEKENKVEVLYLYDEWINKSGLQFVPAASCDEVYCVDKFDRNKFIRTDYVFGKAHEEKLAELEYIAHSLGAKSCSVEIIESSTSTQTHNAKGSSQITLGNCSANADISQKEQSDTTSRTTGKTVTYFDGNNTPVQPKLKWFSNDDSIKRLIDMRCSSNNSIRSRKLVLEGSSSATMSRNAAYALDCALLDKGKDKSQTSMSSQASKEYNSKLIFEIEF